MTIAAISGHRPEKIKDFDWVKEALKEAYLLLEVQKVIQGMAAGVDLTAAKVAHEMGIPYVCARPWAGHTARDGWKLTYASAIRNSEQVVDVDPSIKYPGVWAYQVRNKWMVDRADFVLAVWDGSDGGTANCVRYAWKVGKDVFNLNPKTEKCGFLDPEK